MMINYVLQKILPQNLFDALKKVNADKLCELRIRSGCAVSVSYGGVYHYLSQNGISNLPSNAIVLNEEDINQIMLRACDKSLYAVNDRICKGYLTVNGGIRIGIAGETVFEGNSIKTIKNFTALSIRIPHEVTGCAEKIVPYMRSSDGYHSTLIVSPPGAGKTTLLRDITRIVASDKQIRNVLVADEREEIAAVSAGKPTMNIGINADVISGCTKEYAFINGIRALRPDIIVTDELCGARDTAAVENAIYSGVCVFASVHADCHERLKEKQAFDSLLKNKCFTRYVNVSDARGPGTIEGIYDKNFEPVRDYP